MNSIIFLYAFSVASGVQAQQGFELFSEAEILKNSIDAITKDLADFGKSFVFTYHVELSKQKIENYAAAENALTVILAELRNATKASMVQGNNVSHCYGSTEKYVDTKSKVIFKALDKCMESESSIIDSVSTDIHYHLQREDSILKYLNYIVMYCSSSTPPGVASCISDAMPSLKKIVSEYKGPVNALKDQALSLMYRGVENYYQCADPAMNTFYNELNEVRISHDKCIKEVN